jgi:excisionase family DNA binding protein
MSANKSEQWMTVGEVADELKLKPNQVYKLIKESEIPATRISPRTIRVNRDDLYTWLESRKNTTGGG